MSPENEKRALAFIRTIANRCMSCLVRSEENCSPCTSRWANSILRDIENESPQSREIDYSLAARMLRIRMILERAQKPLLSSEIQLDGLCYTQLKQWTLKRMMRLGVIGRRLDQKTNNNYRTYRYYIIPKKETT